MLFASGKSLGKPSEDFLQKNGALQNFEQTKKLYAKYKSKIIIPSDVIVDNLGKAKVVDSAFLPSDFAILDIGPETARSYAKLISCAGSIVLNGPMGVYEKVQFSSGTKTVLGAVAKSGAFSLLGGGHTLSALEEFNIPYSKFGYVSLSGKALIEFLSGDELPGVKMLEH
jgi:phosphoglycerate kinase